MNNLLIIALLSLFSACSMTLSVQAEEKVEIKKSEDSNWKMKLKRRSDKKWEGTHEGKTYILLGDTAFATVTDDGDYTVYGTMAPNNTYITTSRIERVVVPVQSHREDQEIRENDNTRPSNSKQTPATDNTRPVTPEQTRATDNTRPVTPEQTRATDNTRPAEDAK